MKRGAAWLVLIAVLLSVFPAWTGAESARAEEGAVQPEVVWAETVELHTNKATMDLNGKNRGALRAIVAPANATEKLTWVTNNAQVAVVDENGLITAVGVGECIIGVRGEKTAWAKCRITVINTGYVAPAPAPAPSVPMNTIRFKSTSAKMDINGRGAARVSYAVSPASAQIEWVTTNPYVAQVDETGMVTAVGVGQCIIGARANGGAWAKLKLTVVNTTQANGLVVDTESLNLAPGAFYDVAAAVLPAHADQSMIWQSADPAVASVSPSGRITALARGTTYVRVYSAANRNLFRQITVCVGVNAPSSIQTEQTVYTVGRGGAFPINAKALPETASQEMLYVSSDPSVATVDAYGVVRTLKTGKAVIRIYSAENSSVYASIGVKVVNSIPGSITLPASVLYFSPGYSVTLKATVQPEECKTGIVWASSNTSVATVDASGRVTAHAVGTAVITATTEVANLSASVTVNVLKADYTTTVPARYTTTAGIADNLAKIDAIASSAYAALENSAKTFGLSAGEVGVRRQIIQRAFSMYRFPWMTTVEQPYWRAMYSENGKKDFQPGRVYYGLPYIQNGKTGDTTNRRFNVSSALSGGYFTDSGKGYYLMNQSRKIDSSYVGSDCSSFLSMAQWGTGNAHSYDHTSAMLKTTVYKTIPWSQQMRPGDILVRDGHCLMFLYYINGANTQMMVIEQGGGDASTDLHNTVTCSVVNVSAYQSAGFIIRRQATFAG